MVCRPHLAVSIAMAMALSLAGCVVNDVPPDAGAGTAPAPLAQDRTAPALALLEHVLGEHFAAAGPNPPTTCATVVEGKGDGGGELRALPAEQETRLIARLPALAPLDRCEWNGEAFLDSLTEERAVVFDVHSFACDSATQCTGWAGYTAGNVGSLYALYRMRFEDGAWRFTRDERLLAD